MIREFWVENYLSIKDRQTINFETKSKDDDDLLSIEVSNGIRLNKIGIMYGANASGKSNMLSAILSKKKRSCETVRMGPGNPCR